MDIEIQPGRPPWSPMSGVSTIEVWTWYNVPTSGTFMLDGETIMFVCLDEDAGERPSQWMYVKLHDGDLDGLDAQTEAELFAKQLALSQVRDRTDVTWPS